MEMDFHFKAELKVLFEIKKEIKFWKHDISVRRRSEYQLSLLVVMPPHQSPLYTVEKWEKPQDS